MLARPASYRTFCIWGPFVRLDPSDTRGKPSVKDLRRLASGCCSDSARTGTSQAGDPAGLQLCGIKAPQTRWKLVQQDFWAQWSRSAGSGLQQLASWSATCFATSENGLQAYEHCRKVALLHLAMVVPAGKLSHQTQMMGLMVSCRQRAMQGPVESDDEEHFAKQERQRWDRDRARLAPIVLGELLPSPDPRGKAKWKRPCKCHSCRPRAQQ